MCCCYERKMCEIIKICRMFMHYSSILKQTDAHAVYLVGLDRAAIAAASSVRAKDREKEHIL